MASVLLLSFSLVNLSFSTWSISNFNPRSNKHPIIVYIFYTIILKPTFFQYYLKVESLLSIFLDERCVIVFYFTFLASVLLKLWFLSFCVILMCFMYWCILHYLFMYHNSLSITITILFLLVLSVYDCVCLCIFVYVCLYILCTCVYMCLYGCICLWNEHMEVRCWH